MSIGGAHRLLPAMAAYGIVGSVHSFPASPLPDAEWQQLRSGASAELLTGHLLAAIERHDFHATDAQRADAMQDQRAAERQVRHLEALIMEVTQLLHTHGVQVRILQGAAAAHLDYAAADLRSFRDVDILLRSEDLRPALGLLAATGLTAVQPADIPEEPPPLSVPLRTGDGLKLSVHRTFCALPRGRAGREELWADTEDFALGGTVLHALPRSLRVFDIACKIAADGTEPSLTSLRDIVQLALSSHLDVGRVRETADRWEAQGILADAVTSAWQNLLVGDMTMLSTWAERWRSAHDGGHRAGPDRTRGHFALPRPSAITSLLPTRVRHAWTSPRPDFTAFRVVPNQRHPEPSRARGARASRSRP